MQAIAHVLKYHKTKLATADAADWPHYRLREQIRFYEKIYFADQQIDLEELITQTMNERS